MSEQKTRSKSLGRFIDGLFKGMEYIIAVFLAVMIFFTFLNVVMRQFDKGFAWSEEISRICFIYLVYLGSIIAARENQHLMIDTLISRLSGVWQKALYVLIQGIIIFMMGFLATGAFRNAWKNRNDFWVATHFPVFMVHFAGVILGVAVIIISLVNLYRLFVRKESVLSLFIPPTADLDADEEGAGVQ